MLDWYSQKIPHLLHEFKTDLERGLSRQDAAAQHHRFSSNRIRNIRKSSLITTLLKQFSNLTVVLLLVVVALLFFFQRTIHIEGKYTVEAVVLASVLCFHVFWQFIQEAKTSSQLQFIERHLEVSVFVIRDGAVSELPPTGIIPGDLLLLTEGDYTLEIIIHKNFRACLRFVFKMFAICLSICSRNFRTYAFPIGRRVLGR